MDSPFLDSLLFYVIIGLILVFALILRVVVVWLRAQRQARPTQLPLPVTRRSIGHTLPFNSKSLSADRQPLKWQNVMSQVGRQLASFPVERIELIHGTFMGSDPIQFWEWISHSIEPLQDSSFVKVGQRLTQKSNRFWIADKGNFTEGYRQLLESGLGQNIDCGLFSWSSSNHHAARLIGACELINSVVDARKKNMMLVAHSHGAQVMAIFSQIIRNKGKGKEFQKILDDNGYTKAAGFIEKTGALKHTKIHYITLGSPFRYRYELFRTDSLTHIINRRHDFENREPFSGWLRTINGDYVQLWGTQGSDGLATTSKLRAMNKRLDSLLGPGCDPAIVARSIYQQSAIPEQGKTVFVDFADQSRFPNAALSFFGHACYTRTRHMARLWQIIAETLTSAR